MTAIPLLSGIKATEAGDFAIAYPMNLEPVPAKTGLSEGYVRCAPGATMFSAGPGKDRGGIDWNGTHYRVMGTKLVKVAQSGVMTVIGDVGYGGLSSLAYGFDRLAINSGTSLYYWDNVNLSQVTDSDLGAVLDMLWFGGFFVTTDGTSIIVTQLADPTQVDPLKYGSAEADPDPIQALFKLRGELYALGRFTIQPYSNVGGAGFPFQPNLAATVPVGVVGSRARCDFYQTLAFVGSGRGEAAAVYLLDGGSALKISTRAIDDELAKVADQSSITVESRMSRDERRLLVHLPDKTLVYLANASRISGQAVWYIAASGSAGDQRYRLQNAVYVYGKWVCGDTASVNLGILSDDEPSHFGDPVAWEMHTQLTYNEGKGAILHDIDLVGLPGRGGEKPVAFLSFTEDGETYTQERACSTGVRGDRAKRVQWRPHKRFSNYMGCRFRGSGTAGWAACQATFESLNA